MNENQRGLLLAIGVTMVTETCCKCGILFGIDERHRNWWLDHHNESFYCPNGHGQHYTGKTEAQKERERAEHAEMQAANLKDDLRVERLSHRSTKSNLTKLRSQVAAGKCPCCRRSYKALAKHMATKHPDYSPSQHPTQRRYSHE